MLTLSDLALKEYATLVHTLDPTAVPPKVPSQSTTSNILDATPDLSSDAGEVKEPTPTTLSTAETISNLLVGQKGVHRLFTDFTSTLSAKEKALHSAHAKIEELESALQTLRNQLKSETELRVAAQNERDVALRDDGSAAKVVERYMTFTQKTHATVHMHLDNLRTRSSATQATLRSEIAALRLQLASETTRAEKLRSALDEMSEGFSREAAGRRREVALRLKMLSNEEQRERRVEVWLDKVRRSREGPEGAVVEPDILETLLDEGVEAVERAAPKAQEGKSWKRMFKRKATVIPRDGQEDSIARVFLAEDLVNTLVQDLQTETERRIDLEKQRVEWLAKEAVEGVKPGSDVGGEVMFEGDVDHVEERHDTKESLTVPETTAPKITTPPDLAETPPLLPELRAQFEPLTKRYTPLQKRLHDLSHSVTSLRFDESTPTSSRRLLGRNRSEHILHTLLDSVHEVIEDARVDVEIALADEERVFRGFEALLGVGKSGAVQGKKVLQDADEYVTDRLSWAGYNKLEKRIEDVESDVTRIKGVAHEMEGMDTGDEAAPTKWSEVELRTIAVPARSLLGLPEREAQRRGTNLLSGVGNVGRSFSATVLTAPRRVGSFAGGLYRGPQRTPVEDEVEAEAKPFQAAEDDVDGVE